MNLLELFPVLVPVNYLAVLASAISSMVLGFLWYSKAVFGVRWTKLTGMSSDDMKKAGVKVYGLMFVASLVMAWILAHYIHYAEAFDVVNGVKTGIWAWVGFVIPTSLANHLFSKKPNQLYYINMGYHLVNLMVMGAIISIWR